MNEFIRWKVMWTYLSPEQVGVISTAVQTETKMPSLRKRLAENILQQEQKTTASL